MPRPDSNTSKNPPANDDLWDAQAADSLEPQQPPVEDSTPPVAEDVESVRERFQQQLAAAEQQVLRAQAETENARRRMRRDFDEQLRFASLPLVQDLIDVVDNLARARQAAEQGGVSAIVDGIKMVQAQLDLLLEKHGCRRIDASPGTEFDPSRHSALQMQPHPQIPANHITQETRSGFQLHDRVVRPAEVLVSTGPPSSSGV